MKLKLSVFVCVLWGVGLWAERPESFDPQILNEPTKLRSELNSFHEERQLFESNYWAGLMAYLGSDKSSELSYEAHDSLSLDLKAFLASKKLRFGLLRPTITQIKSAIDYLRRSNRIQDPLFFIALQRWARASAYPYPLINDRRAIAPRISALSALGELDYTLSDEIQLPAPLEILRNALADPDPKIKMTALRAFNHLARVQANEFDEASKQALLNPGLSAYWWSDEGEPFWALLNRYDELADNAGGFLPEHLQNPKTLTNMFVNADYRRFFFRYLHFLLEARARRPTPEVMKFVDLYLSYSKPPLESANDLQALLWNIRVALKLNKFETGSSTDSLRAVAHWGKWNSFPDSIRTINDSVLSGKIRNEILQASRLAIANNTTTLGKLLDIELRLAPNAHRGGGEDHSDSGKIQNRLSELNKEISPGSLPSDIRDDVVCVLTNPELPACIAPETTPHDLIESMGDAITTRWDRDGFSLDLLEDETKLNQRLSQEPNLFGSLFWLHLLFAKASRENGVSTPLFEEKLNEFLQTDRASWYGSSFAYAVLASDKYLSNHASILFKAWYRWRDPLIRETLLEVIAKQPLRTSYEQAELLKLVNKQEVEALAKFEELARAGHILDSEIIRGLQKSRYVKRKGETVPALSALIGHEPKCANKIAKSGGENVSD